MRRTVTKIGLVAGAATLALGLGATAASAAPAASAAGEHQAAAQAAGPKWTYLASYGRYEWCMTAAAYWPPQWYPTCFARSGGWDLYIYV